MRLYCPKCGKPDADVTLSLVDGETFECRECGDEFGLDEVRDLIDGASRWAALVPWIEQHPARKPKPAAKAG